MVWQASRRAKPHLTLTNSMSRRFELIARFSNDLAAIWLILIAVIIVGDVVGRGLFDQPLRGTDEIIANSVVSILFLQMPLTIFDKTMIRATLVYDQLAKIGQKFIDTLVCLTGVALYAGIAFGGWENMILGWQIGEAEGSGALEVPVYPARTIIVILSMFCAMIYALQLTVVWRIADTHYDQMKP